MTDDWLALSHCGKVTERIFLETVSKHMGDKKVSWKSHKVFMKGKSSLANLVAFYKEVTGTLNRGRAAGVACTDLVRPLTHTLQHAYGQIGNIWIH